LKSKNNIQTSYFGSVKQLRRGTLTFLGQHWLHIKVLRPEWKDYAAYIYWNVELEK